MVEPRVRGVIGLKGGVQVAVREAGPPLSESKVALYGAQGGNCNECGTHFFP